ncbi:MAG: glycosyltransferase family 2 protein [Candidatus Thermoplasmatota archaeon]|nr:glycosyltransferase family 2 protein [Candidatus Thermoplasmatota archaeon]MBU4071810.1 glycosyltransferase family 2 protein [Candidatus Thermoplasmatota archaeon]MBU4143953.1 glycosyltransferase family 2 protein [Candidatus Thermoplasmatota archaeon]MBU4592560.1 glycosyltransferase family 2 protein [Candidatus Thermoplasmatota archaeon]
MSISNISILLPALDEAETIGRVIDKIPMKELASIGYNVDVVVVDGHSKDMTCEIAQSMGARLLKQKGIGKGNAVQTAFDNFDGRFLFMLDADDTYDPKEILRMLPHLENGDFDVMMGSRLRGSISKGAMSRLNFIGNVALTRTANILFPNGHQVSDLCTGMWGFTDEVIHALDLEANSFDIEAEMYAKCVKSGFNVGEVNISYGKRTNSNKLSALKDGAKIWFRLLKEYVNQ